MKIEKAIDLIYVELMKEADMGVIWLTKYEREIPDIVRLLSSRYVRLGMEIRITPNSIRIMHNRSYVKFASVERVRYAMHGHSFKKAYIRLLSTPTRQVQENLDLVDKIVKNCQYIT